MKEQTTTLNQESLQTTWSLPKTVQIIGVILLGSVILYGTGFVNIAAVHNATHDARHSQGFPCH